MAEMDRHPLRDCLGVREFFIGLLARLNWNDAANFFRALPRNWRNQLFAPSVWYPSFIAPRVHPLSMIGLQPAPISFEDFMSVWHMSVHAIDIRIRSEHAILRSNYNFAVDSFVPGRLLGVPPPAGAGYSALIFLPSIAPTPFQNSLWVCQTPGNEIKILQPRMEGLASVAEFVVPSEIRSFAVSPGGTTVLLLNDVHKLSLVRLGEYSMELRITQAVVPSGETFKNSVFVDEDSFVARDRNWTFWVYTHDRVTNAFSKRMLFTPELLFPTTVTKSGKRMYRCFPDMGRVGKGSYLYLPAVPPPGESPDCLAIAEYCCTPGVDRQMKHPSLCHVLQLAVSPGSGCRPYYLVVESGLITDYIADYERRCIFIVVLTWSSETLFRTFPPRATRIRPSHCSMTFDVPNMTSLCIYRLGLSVFDGGPGSVGAEPLFYVPSEKFQLMSPPITDPDAGEGRWSEKKFSRTYSMRSDWHYRASCCRRYLAVCHSPFLLLLFSLASKKKTPPFELSLAESVDVRTVSCSEELFLVAGISNPPQKSNLKICAMCPRNADLFQIEMQSPKLARDNTVKFTQLDV